MLPLFELLTWCLRNHGRNRVDGMSFLTFIFSFIFCVFVAAICAYVAERLVPNTVPGGFTTSAAVGTIGAWIGGSLIGHLGPDFAGVSLINCLLGSAALVFVLSLVSNGFRHTA